MDKFTKTLEKMQDETYATMDKIEVVCDGREKDIQEMCKHIISMPVENTGDHGKGGQCPFCLKECYWNDELTNIKHDPDCIYLIAKDLSSKP